MATALAANKAPKCQPAMDDSLTKTRIVPSIHSLLDARRDLSRFGDSRERGGAREGGILCP